VSDRVTPLLPEFLRCVRWQIAILLVAVALAYANSLANSFTLDDELYVQRNPQVTRHSLRLLFEPNAATNVYRPLTFATLAANWMAAGYSPFGYHLVNLLLQAAVVLLLFFVLRQLLEGVDGSASISFAAALLFAVHPIHTEAVSSIVGRSELLAAGFLLAAWLLHLRDRSFMALAAFALALLSKESAIVLLPLVLAGDFAMSRMKSWTRYAGIALVTLLYLGLLWKIQGGHFGSAAISAVDNPLAALSLHWRVLNAVRIAWKYVALLIFPATLSCDYSYNQIPVFTDIGHLLFPLLAALAVCGAWLCAMWTRKKGLILAGAIFFAGFAVTSNIFLRTGTIFGERLAYLPSAGFCLLLALGIWWIATVNRNASLVVLLLIVAAFSVRTALRNRDWRDNATLYTADAASVPNSAKMRTFRGLIYLGAGQFDLARSDFDAALNIFPASADTVEAMGLLEARTGNNKAALLWMKKAVEISDRRDFDYDYRAVNLAAFEIQSGRLDDALQLLNREIAESPGYSRSWSNRAVAHLKLGQPAAAQSDAKMALQLDPANAQAQGVLRAIPVVGQP
jgi:tetratricopeptide (TPR) repeat protein